ncbi:uncharacterized protein PG998_002858 [Apiospora kogelbergensis]|uniref:Uncharacterized protein n=1 Tax=Apiospora kogelbergensis TaxID=1337665 RepID=A0AAW0Q6J8_9PEZI
MKTPFRLVGVCLLALLVAEYGHAFAAPTTDKHYYPKDNLPDYAPEPCICSKGTPGLKEKCEGHEIYGFVANLRWETNPGEWICRCDDQDDHTVSVAIPKGVVRGDRRPSSNTHNGMPSLRVNLVTLQSGSD